MDKRCTLHAHIVRTARTDSACCTHTPLHTARTLQSSMVHLMAIRRTMTYFAQARNWWSVDWLDAI